MENPFRYGEVVDGSDFADRERELKNLVSDLASASRIFLVSPRRYGKTSLITQALVKLKEKGLLTAYLDIFSVSSKEEFANLYFSKLLTTLDSPIDKVLQFIKELLPSLRPEMSINAEGDATVSLGLRQRSRDLQDVLDLPEKIAVKKNKRMVVALDEFQEITNLGGEAFEKLLRSHMQQHKKVSYIFAGSKRHALYAMVTNRSRAFYNLGKLMTLDKIPEDLFASHLLEKFKKTGIAVDRSSLNKIIAATDNVPHNVQMLCHELWELTHEEKVIRDTHIAQAMDSLVKTRSTLYSTIWESLSLHQRRLLKAIANENKVRAVTAADFLERHALGPATSVQRSVSRLIDRELLDKQEPGLVFTDSFFKEWIHTRLGQS